LGGTTPICYWHAGCSLIASPNGSSVAQRSVRSMDICGSEAPLQRVARVAKATGLDPSKGRPESPQKRFLIKMS